MDKVILENEILTVKVNLHGAEVSSVRRDGAEYMWYADPKFWGRTAPVLFPIVGMLNEKKYQYEGKKYEMGQHGLARDCDFTIKSLSSKEAWFELCDNEETYKKYPFHFRLEIGYKLIDDALKVIWKVTNPSDEKLLFSVGGHPAFLCPWNEDVHTGENADPKSGYKLKFSKNGLPVSAFQSKVLEGSYVGNGVMNVETENGMLTLDEHTFDIDTFIIEDRQVDEVSIVAKDGKEYLTVKFDCPLIGIWSPPKKNAPFVCIEPWYGRCDRVGFDGDFSKREYTQTLLKDESFEGGFTVEFK